MPTRVGGVLGGNTIADEASNFQAHLRETDPALLVYVNFKINVNRRNKKCKISTFEVIHLKKSNVFEITTPYRDMTEWVRAQRNCFACDYKHSDRCKNCPPPKKLADILALLSLANQILKKNGYRLPTDEKQYVHKVDRNEENL